MVTLIPDVLPAPVLARLREQLRTGHFGDGRDSAGPAAARVKHNLELAGDEARAPGATVLGALHRHPQFQAAALPLRLSAATFARYEAGMAYGPHTDDPVMGPPGGRYRCDIAITIWLSEPAACEGGELELRSGTDVTRYKASAGTAIVYPADTLHAVTPVTSGERLVALSWAQSMVASAERRRLLYDLWCVRETLRTATPDARVTAEADRVYTGLVRMWAEV